MNQTLNDLIKELGTKKQVKVEYLLPKLKKIKREIEPKKAKIVDSFGNVIKKGDLISRTDISKETCIRYMADKEQINEFEGLHGLWYIADDLRWKFALSVKAYKANPKKYNKLLGIK